MQDLALLDTANQGAAIRLFHPGTNADLGIIINVLGQDSEQFTKKQSEQQRKRTQRIRNSGTFRFQPPSLEEMTADTVELLVAVTTGWASEEKQADGAIKTEQGLKIGEEVIPFNAENARMVYTRYKWIREQIDSAVMDRGNFLPTSGTR